MSETGEIATNGRPDGETVLCVQNLDIDRRGRPVLRNTHLRVRENQLVGLVGPNGGGKTTLLRAVIGLETPARGRIQFPQCRHGRRPRIGFLPQGEGRADQAFPISAYDLVGLGGGREAERIEEALRDMGLEPHLWRRPIGRLSGGQRRRAFLAMMLADRNRLLLLDEPCESLDHRAREKLRRALLGLRSRRRLSALIATHDLQLLRGMDRIYALDGCIFARGRPDRLLRPGGTVLRRCGVEDGWADAR